MRISKLLKWNHFLFKTEKVVLLKNLRTHVCNKLKCEDVIVTLSKKGILKIEGKKPNGPIKPILVLDCGCAHSTEYYGKVTDIDLEKGELTEICREVNEV